LRQASTIQLDVFAYVHNVRTNGKDFELVKLLIIVNAFVIPLGRT